VGNRRHDPNLGVGAEAVEEIERILQAIAPRLTSTEAQDAKRKATLVLRDMASNGLEYSKGQSIEEFLATFGNEERLARSLNAAQKAEDLHPDAFTNMPTASSASSSASNTQPPYSRSTSSNASTSANSPLSQTNGTAGDNKHVVMIPKTINEAFVLLRSPQWLDQWLVEPFRFSLPRTAILLVPVAYTRP
jgi:hypothetical protein